MVLPSKAYEEWEKHAYSGTDIEDILEALAQLRRYYLAVRGE